MPEGRSFLLISTNVLNMYLAFLLQSNSCDRKPDFAAVRCDASFAFSSNSNGIYTYTLHARQNLYSNGWWVVNYFLRLHRRSGSARLRDDIRLRYAQALGQR